MVFTLKQKREQSPNKSGSARILGIFAHFVAVLCKSATWNDQFPLFLRTLSTTANLSYFWLFGSEVLSAAFSAESRLHTEKHTVKPRHLPWSFLFFFSFLLFFIPWIPRKRINHRHYCLREELNSTPSTLVKENEIYLDLKMSVPNCLFVRFLNLGPERHWSLLQFKEIFLLNF